eukprot:gene37328-46059_t
MIEIKGAPETAALRRPPNQTTAQAGSDDNPPMQIRFTKMQGAGNDFVVLDETQGRLGLTATQYRYLADRHFGVGADQILTVRRPTSEAAAQGIDFEYVIHNADGGEVEQCGNGSRCFARYVRDKGLTDKDTIRVQTLSGVIAPRLTPDGRVTVDMGRPVLEPARVPFDTTGLFTPIRDLFATVPTAKERGYSAGRFSFNVKGGRCEACQGDGVIKVEMHFLPDVYVPCDVCHGKRYNRETLEVHYKGKSITQVLDMTVEDAYEFFKPVPVIARKLHTLLDVGLGYIKLGQSATTLSGGEAQRVKLSLELSKRDTGRTLYILDEPTTGLHFHDIDLLLKVIHRLRDQGNTLAIIEHNLDVIKTADWIVDLGPEGGAGGGQIIAAGSPEDVAANPASVTGKYLIPLLKPAKKK